jgi:LmbE family N-acetylglucosaminyl deacetylase
MHRPVPVESAPPATLAFNDRSRILLVAPHPDDESLACGMALQAAVRAGAAVRVVYATDGDNNPWPQRFIERKWRIKKADRLRWGKLRQREAEAALITLGLQAEDACFLGLPDQGLTDRLMRDPASLLSRFARCIEDFAPTDMFLPSTADAHPDHNALAVALLLILRQLDPQIALESVWHFVVHGRNPAFFAHARTIEGTRSEIATKVRAIKCHQT